MPTKQETFDIVARHLLTQGCKAESNDQCQYRADGRMCAAGVLIPDDLYDPEWDRRGATIFSCPGDPDSGLQAPGECIKEQGHDLVLVDQLQDVHDTSTVYEWMERLSFVAKLHNLSTAVLEEFDGPLS